MSQQWNRKRTFEYTRDRITRVENVSYHQYANRVFFKTLPRTIDVANYFKQHIPKEREGFSRRGSAITIWKWVLCHVREKRKYYLRTKTKLSIQDHDIDTFLWMKLQLPTKNMTMTELTELKRRIKQVYFERFHNIGVVRQHPPGTKTPWNEHLDISEKEFIEKHQHNLKEPPSKKFKAKDPPSDLAVKPSNPIERQEQNELHDFVPTDSNVSTHPPYVENTSIRKA